jgi:hypothetical protein
MATFVGTNDMNTLRLGLASASHNLRFLHHITLRGFIFRLPSQALAPTPIGSQHAQITMDCFWNDRFQGAENDNDVAQNQIT